MINVRRSKFFLSLAGVVACCAMLAIPASARADASSQPSWKVHEKLLGKPKNAAGTDFKKSEDASGIACASPSGFPRVCLVVDDESQGAQIVIVKDGELIAGDFIRLITDSHAGKLLELDAEGAAFADGAFYVIGSHGRARHEADATEGAKNNAKADATRRVFRIRFNAEAVDLNTGKLTGTPEIKPADLSRFIQAQPELAASFDKPLKQKTASPLRASPYLTVVCMQECAVPF
jgi:hypothetical protein